MRQREELHAVDAVKNQSAELSFAVSQEMLGAAEVPHVDGVANRRGVGCLGLT